MTDSPATTASIGGIVLLERAINYTLGSLHVVRPEALAGPTPCQEWNLRELLAHLNDSLLGLTEAIEVGHIGHAPPQDVGADPVTAVRDRARHLLGAWTGGPARSLVSVSGQPLTSQLVTGTGAVEIAVHGWDVARACGWRRPIPASLAAELLDLAPLLIHESDRPLLFAPPVPVDRSASASDRLVAFLGRSP